MTTARAAAALARFGLLPDDTPHTLRPDDALVQRLASEVSARLLDPISPARLVLVTGPSGAGKSTLVRAIGARLSQLGVETIDLGAINLSPRPIVDLLKRPLDESLRILAHSGLGEAALFARKPIQLSEGQRHRLRLALALDASRRSASPAALLADEFLQMLDRPTARSVAASARRSIVQSPDTCLVAATSHDDLSDVLAPHLHIHLSLDGEARLDAPAPTEPRCPFLTEPASFDAYLALARFHYRAAPPATRTLTLAARDPATRELVGALVVSMPTLNGAWRKLAWPGRYSPPSPSATKRLNEEVRCISRVVVDPRFRARGCATALVRRYLAEPQTIHTEAVASMGAACPMFARAGMTEHILPPRAQDARLLHVLSSLRIPRSRLATPADMLRRLPPSKRRALHQAARTWANHSRRDRTARDEPLEALLRRAARTVLANPIAYTHQSRALEAANVTQ